MAKADKATAVAEIVEEFKSSSATVVTEYRGLTVANLAELRRSLTGQQAATGAKRKSAAGFEPFPAKAGVVITNDLVNALRDAEGV